MSDARAEVEFVNRERFNGMLAVHEGVWTLRSATFGTLTLTPDEIVAVRCARETLATRQLVSPTPHSLASIGLAEPGRAIADHDAIVGGAGETRAPGAGGTAPAQAASDADNKGVRDEDNRTLSVAMRAYGSILPKGDYQVSTDSFYGCNKEALTEQTQRIFQETVSVTRGLGGGMDAGVSVPVCYRTYSYGAYDPQTMTYQTISTDRAGLGDVRGSLRYGLHAQTAVWPEITAGVTVQAPTGVANELALGSGTWGVSPSLTAIKTTDPVAFFGTLSYGHNWKGRDSVDRMRTDSMNWSLGVAFSANYEVSLGASLNGTWYQQRALSTSDLSTEEEVQLRYWSTIKVTKDWWAELYMTQQVVGPGDGVGAGLQLIWRK
ncbi:MAG: hypothetical protein IPL39_14170 [Opitutaceae bacterium]|nr:hypothetical protein [Opitutaceae bacterium]